MKGEERTVEEKKKGLETRIPDEVASSGISGGSALDSGPWKRFGGACSRAMLVGMVGRGEPHFDRLIG